MDAIQIRRVTTLEGCRQFQALDDLIWGGSDPRDLVPNHVTVTIVKNGGLLLGAYASNGPDETGGMVGAALGWLGTGVDPAQRAAGARLKFCSHIVGVLPAWQGLHIGLRLKLAQRREVLAQGLTDWITWTYDPLYRRNGVFNFHRLGATCSTYVRDMYGELQDVLNAGVPSDRCEVDWRLTSPHVLHDLERRRPTQPWDAAMLQILSATLDERAFAVPGDPAPALDGRGLAVPVPDDIAAIRRADPGLARAWRHALRAMLETAFVAGYTMVDCVHLGAHGWRYILVREY
jgi:predicted GNAT superfamily acetyltransferase